MEYLVTMTTQVPEGTSASDVDAMRAREAEHTRELAAQGRVLRLWRPPLAPGEWRTLGLFAAEDADDLERTLASMPLRVWRTDEPVALGVHGNDPGRGAVAPVAGDDEYLVTFNVRVPEDASAEVVEKMNAGEAARARELAGEGRLVRLWALPKPSKQAEPSGPVRNLSLWQAPDPGTIEAALASLPMTAAGWLTVETVPLTGHPSDPG
jgi:muconolactone delta-isomerase